MTEELSTTQSAIDYAQLSEIRVPLDRAGAVFAQKDANGRTPIILVPLNPHRLNNTFTIAGAAAFGIGAIIGLLQSAWLWPLVGVGLAVGLIGYGFYRSFMVRIPEATTALISRAGRHVDTLEPGPKFLPPWFAVSHLVTQREIPYDVPAVEGLTKDNVRAIVDTLVTFAITDGYRFVYTITADDFDEILLASCLDAIRGEIRRLAAEEIADLTQYETTALLQSLNEGLESYGVTIKGINITDARPPEAFLRSQENRQLAVFQRAEQAEKQSLAQRQQADADVLAREHAIAEVEREREALQAQVQAAEVRKRIVELDAEAESLRLATLNERLHKYPLAAGHEIQCIQLEIARALAGNSRALLQVGIADDLLRSLTVRQFLQSEQSTEGDMLQATADGDGEPMAA